MIVGHDEAIKQANAGMKRRQSEEAEIDRLRAAMTIADERLQQAAIKAGVLYMGCDTPDALVDTICALRAEIERLESALDEQHAGTDAVWNEKAELVKEVERLKFEIEHKQDTVDNLRLQLGEVEVEAERDALGYTVVVGLGPIARFKYADHAHRWACANWMKSEFSIIDAARRAGEER